MEKEILLLALLLIGELLCGHVDHKDGNGKLHGDPKTRHDEKVHIEERVLIPNLLTVPTPPNPSSLPLCNVLCSEGANWILKMPPYNISIVYDQNSSTMALLQDVGQGRSIGFALTKNVNAYSIFFPHLGIAAVFKGSHIGLRPDEQLRPGIPEGASTNFTFDNILPGLREISRFIEKWSQPPVLPNTTVNKWYTYDGYVVQVMSSVWDAYFTPYMRFFKWKPLIAYAIKMYFQSVIGSGTAMLNGPAVFASMFGLLSMDNGVTNNQISDVLLGADLAWVATLSNNASTSNNASPSTSKNITFSITSNGKIVQNSKVLGELNLNQQGQLPGNISVSPSSWVNVIFADLTPPTSTPGGIQCIVSPLVNSLGNSLGIPGVTYPVTGLLNNVAGVIRPLLNQVSGGLTEPIASSLESALTIR